MKNLPIFILGLPRSGTTLMMRLFNSNPGVLIQGEQSGAYDLVAKAYRAYCTDLHKRHSRNLSTDGVETLLRSNGWVAPVSTWSTVNLSRYFKEITEAIGNPTGRDIRWGFKEVLFTDDVGKALFELYPACKIVLTTRRCEQYVRSVRNKNWSKSPRDDVLNWNWRMGYIESIAKSYPANTRLLRYEDMTREALQDTLAWAGVGWTPAADVALATVVDATAGGGNTAEEADEIARNMRPTLTYD